MRKFAAKPLIMQAGPACITLAVFLVFILCNLYFPALYAALMRNTVAIPNAVPFNDLNTVILAAKCWQQGVNVYAYNGCMHGVYNYSPFLLRISNLNFAATHRILSGLTLDILFIASLAALPPALSRSELVLRIFASLSTSMIFVLELSNIDALLFIITCISVLLLARPPLVSLLAYPLIALMAAMKFYPVVLLALVLNEKLARMLVLAAGIIISAIIFIAHYRSDIATVHAILPGGLPFSWLFGVINLPLGIILLAYMPQLTMQPSKAQYLTAISHPGALSFCSIGVTALLIITIIGAFMLARFYSTLFNALPPARRLFLVAAALLMVFCYFLAQNVDYRGIFLLMALPGLASMASNAQGAQKTMLLADAIIIVMLMWESLFRLFIANQASVWLGNAAVYPEIAFWLLRDLLWFWLIIQLAGFIVAFGRRNIALLYTQTMA